MKQRWTHVSNEQTASTIVGVNSVDSLCGVAPWSRPLEMPLLSSESPNSGRQEMGINTRDHEPTEHGTLCPLGGTGGGLQTRRSPKTIHSHISPMT